MKVPQEIKDKPTQVIQSQSYYEVSRTQVFMNHQVLMEHLSLRIDILARVFVVLFDVRRFESQTEISSE